MPTVIASPIRKRINVSELKESAWNPKNRCEKSKLTELMDSMDLIGMLHPITITQQKQVVDGHRRLAAAKLLRWKEVECSIVEGDAAEIYASINVTARRMSGNDALGVYLTNPNAISVKMRHVFEKMENVITRSRCQKMYRNGLSARAFAVAKMVTRYTGQETEDFLCTTLDWLMVHQNIGYIRSLIRSEQNPQIILAAIKRGRPVTVKLAVA